jgi:hypothetical protein
MQVCRASDNDDDDDEEATRWKWLAHHTSAGYKYITTPIKNCHEIEIHS